MIKSQIETRLLEQMNGRDQMFIASTSRQAFANTFVIGCSSLSSLVKLNILRRRQYLNTSIKLQTLCELSFQTFSPSKVIANK